jgi:hypothetical protein
LERGKWFRRLENGKRKKQRTIKKTLKKENGRKRPA